MQEEAAQREIEEAEKELEEAGFPTSINEALKKQ